MAMRHHIRILRTVRQVGEGLLLSFFSWGISIYMSQQGFISRLAYLPARKVRDAFFHQISSPQKQYIFNPVQPFTSSI